jgi:hypothetical protein
VATTILSSPERSPFGTVRFDVVGSQRSWWQVRYSDGRELSEWETVIGAPKNARPDSAIWRETRWEDVPKRGIVAMRLLCPNGLAGNLETNNPEGRFFQLKDGALDVAFMGGGSIATRKRAAAHIIGCVGDDGEADCWSYENAPHPYAARIEDGTCLTCRLDRADCSGRDVRLREHDELVEWVPDASRPAAVVRSRETIRELVGEYVPLVHFRDDVVNWRYRGIAMTLKNLDVHGVRL